MSAGSTPSLLLFPKEQTEPAQTREQAKSTRGVETGEGVAQSGEQLLTVGG